MSIGSIAGSIAKKAVGNAGKDRMRQRMADINKRNPDEDAEGGDLQTEQASSVPAEPITTKPVEQAPEQAIEQSREFREELDSPWTQALQSPEAKEHNRRQAEAVEAGATSFEDGDARRYIDPKQFREDAVADAWREETQKLAAPEPRTDLNWTGRGGYSYALNLDDPSNPSVTWTDREGKTGVWTPENEKAWNAIMDERNDQLDGVTPAPKAKPVTKPADEGKPVDEGKTVNQRNIPRDLRAPEGVQQRIEPGVSEQPAEVPPIEATIAQQSSYMPQLADAGKEGGQDNPMPAAKTTGAKAALEQVETAKKLGLDPTFVSKQLQAIAQTYPDEAQNIKGIIDDYIDYTGGEIAKKAQR